MMRDRARLLGRKCHAEKEQDVKKYHVAAPFRQIGPPRPKPSVGKTHNTFREQPDGGHLEDKWYGQLRRYGTIRRIPSSSYWLLTTIV